MVATYSRYCTLQINAEFFLENLKELDHQSFLSLDASIIFTRKLKGIVAWNALINPWFGSLVSYYVQGNESFDWMKYENFCILDIELRSGALFSAVRYRNYVALLTKIPSDNRNWLHHLHIRGWKWLKYLDNLY